MEAEAAWAEAQSYELRFWREVWSLRDLPRAEIAARRFGDAVWLLGGMGYPPPEGHRVEGFAGRVLEVGCGPIGFFELLEGIDCDAIDTLMAAYARELPYARLGRAGATRYLDQGIEACGAEYDFVVCSNVLDHTADWRRFLGAVCAAVRPGGRLLLYTHARGAPADGHPQAFSPGAVVDAVVGAGLTTVEVCRVGPLPPHAEHEVFVRALRPD